MNILLDDLPYAVEIGGKAVPINTSYRVGIRFERLMKNPEYSEQEAIMASLLLFYGENLEQIEAEDITEAVEKAMWFYRCETDADKMRDDEDDDKRRVFSYTYDADYIYDAFMIAYGVDLTKEDLHWWKFRSMFRSLPDTTQFMKIVSYRAIKVHDKASREEKAFYAKMKRIFALPKDELVTGREKKVADDLENMLMNGGNPSAILEELTPDQ